MQNVVVTILLTGWLGGLATETRPGEIGRLLTIEEVGQILKGVFISLHYSLHYHMYRARC